MAKRTPKKGGSGFFAAFKSNRIIQVVTLFCLAFAILLGRSAWIQIVKGDEYKRDALIQQTTDNTVSAKRGNIYDRNYTVLATNMTVETVSIEPAILRESISSKSLSVEDVAGRIGEILAEDTGSVKDKINKQSSFEYLKKRIDKTTADELRTYVSNTGLSGINFVEDVKRYYPYNNFASQVIGFCGSDNQGLDGIESAYDDVLSGVPGRVVSTQQSTGLESGGNYESYIEAQDGNSVVLTIDETIQGFVEKHLENARVENKLKEGAAAIVMDVNTAEILAMCTKPDYDLNEPFVITDAIEEKYPGVTEELKGLEGEAYSERFNEVIQTVRRNKAVVDSYEPGSTFKSVTASIALESSACSLEDQFTCGGSYTVQDRSIRCANTSGHGTQTFAEAVKNSCNPAFIQIGQKIGKEKFLEGAEAFGFFSKTGIELPGENTGVGFSLDNFTDVDLATSSFGQSITVTPLQMVTAVSAIANGGRLLKPHLVKQIVNSDMGIVENIETEVVRQVISEETSDQMCEILESVVSEGGGKNAYLAGYRIAGKTGTSEKYPRNQNKYVASFIGFAPADDPQVVCLVLLDEPQGDSYYGGAIAAPVVRDILEETLQYLDVEPRYNEDEEAYVDVDVPDITGMTVEEAESALAEQELEIRVEGSSDNIITDQIPKANTKATVGAAIVAYTEGEKATRTVEVPDLIGESVSSVNSIIVNNGLNAKIKGVSKSGGSAVCVEQSPVAGTMVEPGTVITVDFRYSDSETVND